jgi:succinylarginine dihydrolase
MANGGGPACLRLRVVADPARVDPRFLVDEAKLDRLDAVIAEHWPESIDPSRLSDRTLHLSIEAARTALLDALDLAREAV